MGPYPHDAPRATVSDHNPMGTDGFAFVEFAHPEPAKLHALFRLMGFTEVARHRRIAATLYRQGAVDLIVNEEPGGHAMRFAAEHGPCASAMGFRVADARHAYDRATRLGAESAETLPGTKTLGVPAIAGIGGVAVYLCDKYGETGSTFADDFAWTGEADPTPAGLGLSYIDHLTHNVHRGQMDRWAGYYEKLFNFREIRFFNIEGRQTGLFSRALTSPDGRIRIPLNESQDEKSQIEEYLREYKGEGIQHTAFGCENVFDSVERLRADGLPFMPSPPDTYYERVDTRVPGHGESLERMHRTGILIDGEGVVNGGETRVLLQIFSANVLGPIFFEFIQRKGDEGFGEGNFRALFVSIEEDQVRRGVLTAA